MKCKKPDTPVHVTVWNEYRHERGRPEVRAIHPHGIHTAIAEGLQERGNVQVHSATLDERAHGLSPDVLDATDVLIW